MKNKDGKKLKDLRTVKGARKFFADFKAFIKKGNVLDLAVAVIIGSAFTAIVTSMTKDIIMPLITALFSACGVKGGLNGMSVVLNGVPALVLDNTTNTMVANPEAILWNYGKFIQAIIDFLLIAFVVFIIVKVINAAKQKSLQAMEQLEKLRAKNKDKAANALEEQPEAEVTTAVAESPKAAPTAPDTAQSEETATPVAIADEAISTNDNQQIITLLKEIKVLLQRNPETK